MVRGHYYEEWLKELGSFSRKKKMISRDLIVFVVLIIITGEERVPEKKARTKSGRHPEDLN